MTTALPMATSILLALVSSSALAGESAVPRRDFPLVVTSANPGEPVEFACDPLGLAAIDGLDDVQFPVVPLPDAPAVHVVLHRVHSPIDADAIHVDGVLTAFDLDLTLWDGRVSGDDGSAVFLAFSRYGSRGFVRTQGRHYELLAGPNAQGSWDGATSYFASESDLIDLGADRELSCAGTTTPVGKTAPNLNRSASTMLAATTVTPIYNGRIAIETDTQYYGLFGNLTAAQTYLTSLLGAISYRYREQIGVILTFPYIGYHTSTDPWSSPENGGGAGGMLGEFQNAWGNGQGPVNADLYHFVSGANLGGGVAYLPALCDQFWGFGVSGNIGGNTPIPVTQGSLTWDFMVIAHELGHNFGAPHTHDYCPPADSCAPNGYFGGCQTQQICTSQGTIMSYCHLCGGGMNNITTYFHPQSVTDMRNLVLGGCLALYEGFTEKLNLGFAKVGSNGTPNLDVTYTNAGNVVTFNVTSAPLSKVGVLFVATQKLQVAFNGGTLIPAAQLLLPMSSNGAGTAMLGAPVPATTPIPGGATLYAQAWFNDVAPFYPSATNGIQFELIVP